MDVFKQRLLSEWLIPFCDRYGYSDAGFVSESVDKLSAIDAKDFMLAVDEGLVIHENGFFCAPCSKANEQIFWQTNTKSDPVKITLWLEPIITIAGLLRLHKDYGWPINQLGMQSKTWAFDLVAYSSDLDTEMIACEVKKTWQEIEKLITLMDKHNSSPEHIVSTVKNSERNALKKVIGLRQSRAPVFWALGPGGQSKIFEVVYDNENKVTLMPSDEKSLSLK